MVSLHGLVVLLAMVATVHGKLLSFAYSTVLRTVFMQISCISVSSVSTWTSVIL